jgi:hypothetical protein
VLFDKENQTGLAVVMVEGSGQNRIVVYPGANARLSNSDIEDAFTCCPDALLIQCEIENESVYYAINEANEQGAKVFLDAGPAKADFDLSRLGKLCVFSPNESETLFFTGINPNCADNCLKVKSVTNITENSGKFFAETSLSRIMNTATINSANYVLIAHNHPSDCDGISSDDVAFTNALEEMLSKAGIFFIDHIVISKGKYMSVKSKIADDKAKELEKEKAQGYDDAMIQS